MLSATFIGLALALGAATFVLRPDVVDRLRGKPQHEVVQKSEPAPSPQPRAGDLLIHLEPERAQVLRFVGRGPVSVPHVPLGVAHEFVAVMDGFAPTRLVVQPDAEWERTAEGEQLEIAMQLGPKTATSEASLEVGLTQMPTDVGTPKGALGTVRVVTTPKGAKVYQLVGFAPEARIENLPLDETQELLVSHKGFAPQIKVVAPSDFVARAGARPTATVDLKLAPLPKSPR